MGYLSEIKEGSAYQRDGNRILGEEHWLGFTGLEQHLGMFDEFNLVE